MMVSKAIVAREPVPSLTINWSLEEVKVSSPGDDEVLVIQRWPDMKVLPPMHKFD